MTMRHLVARSLVVALALAAPLVLTFGLAAETPAENAANVKIDNFSFEPAVLTIAPGTTVTWLNADDVPHVVRTEDKTFKSPALDTDDTFSYTFETKGTYPYFCSLHPKMVGKVVVQ
jgi:plastocyanin